jgi:hypothetical protein
MKRDDTGYLTTPALLAAERQVPTPPVKPVAKPPVRLTAAQRDAAAADWAYFEVELFTHIAEEAPQLLFGPWRVLHELVRSSSRYLTCPSATVGDIEDGTAAHLCPYLDVDALHADWESLKARVWLIS